MQNRQCKIRNARITFALSGFAFCIACFAFCISSTVTAGAILCTVRTANIGSHFPFR